MESIDRIKAFAEVVESHMISRDQAVEYAKKEFGKLVQEAENWKAEAETAAAHLENYRQAILASHAVNPPVTNQEAGTQAPDIGVPYVEPTLESNEPALAVVEPEVTEKDVAPEPAPETKPEEPKEEADHA